MNFSIIFFLFICLTASCCTSSVPNGIEPWQDTNITETQAFKRKRDTYHYYSNITRTESVVNATVKTTDDNTCQRLISTGSEQATEACARCICKASYGCELEAKCYANACGPFRITQSYWNDAGKPTLPGFTKDSSNAYSECTTDMTCASNVVQEYMRKHGKDCNGDGVVNCYDYMAMHHLGAAGCTGKMPQFYTNAFHLCIVQ